MRAASRGQAGVAIGSQCSATFLLPVLCNAEPNPIFFGFANSPSWKKQLRREKFDYLKERRNGVSLLRKH